MSSTAENNKSQVAGGPIVPIKMAGRWHWPDEMIIEMLCAKYALEVNSKEVVVCDGKAKSKHA